ncbi:MAG: hypothetical protein E6G67_02405, partial [Actinobacteria bacterium]
LPPILKRFRDEHPQVAFSVRTGHSEEVLELVLREQVDVGLVRAVRHPEIASVPLYEDQLVLVVEPSAFLPQTACAGELDDGSLQAVEIEDAEPVRRQIVAIRRRNAGPPSKIVDSFLQTLRRLAPT